MVWDEERRHQSKHEGLHVLWDICTKKLGGYQLYAALPHQNRMVISCGELRSAERILRARV